MKKLFLPALVAASIVATPVFAQTSIRAASAFGPTHMNAISTYPYIFDKLEELTDGRYTGQDYPSGLLTPQEMTNGLRDGIADMGAVIMLYFPSDFVESSLPGELSVVGSDPRAIGAAATEYIVTCPECVAEFTKVGQVYLGSSATAPYNIMSTKPVGTLDEISGQSIRATGAVFSRWIESLGANVVQIPSSEVFEALNQGVADGTYGALPELINGGLFDVIKYASLVKVGVFCSDGVANVSGLLWNDLSSEDREAFAKAVQYGSVKATYTWLENADKAKSEGQALGIVFNDPNDEILAKKQEFIEAHLAGVVQTLTDKGVTNAEEKVARYKQLVAKWEDLIKSAGDDVDAIGDLRYQEIWSKVDMSSYGS